MPYTLFLFKSFLRNTHKPKKTFKLHTKLKQKDKRQYGSTPVFPPLTRIIHHWTGRRRDVTRSVIVDAALVHEPRRQRSRTRRRRQMTTGRTHARRRSPSRRSGTTETRVSICTRAHTKSERKAHMYANRGSVREHTHNGGCKGFQNQTYKYKENKTHG